MLAPDPSVTSPPPLPGKRLSGLTVILWPLGGLLLVVLAVVTWYAAARLADRKVVRRLEAEARQKGEPLTLAELAALYPPIPDEQNAAVALLESWEKENPAFWSAFRQDLSPLLKRSGPPYDLKWPYLEKKQSNFKVGQKLTPASRQAAEIFLQKQAPHLAEIRSALQRPRSRFPIKIQNGTAAELPHLSTLRTEAQSFKVVALLAADRGDTDV